MATVLLVDDDDLLRRLLSRELRKLGYTVIEAGDGRVAVQSFEETPVDAVVTDVVMPEQEGIETIRSLRRLAPLVPIIAMSGGARGTDHVLRVAVRLGADEALEKPFEVDRLHAMLQELLRAGARG